MFKTTKILAINQECRGQCEEKLGYHRTFD